MLQKVCDEPQQFMKRRLVISKNQHIIHIADVPLDPQMILQKMIQFAQVEVGEVLAVEIANRNPLTGKTFGDRVIDDPIQQLKQRCIFDLAPQQRFQYDMCQLKRVS